MRNAPGMLRFVWYALLLATPVIMLIPFQDDGGMKTAGWLGGYPANVAGHIYGLIKVAMPWLVPGVLLSLMMPRASIQHWAVVAAAVCFLTGWATVPSMAWSEVKEILFVLPGLAAGIWMGEQTQQSKLFSAATTGTQGATIKPVAPVSAPFPGASGASKESDAPGIPARSKRVQMAGRLAALLLMAVGLVTAVDFPGWPIVYALGLTAYAVVLLFWPSAWLITVPAALPLLDLAPWTGRFFWDEFDLLTLVTLAVALWQGRLRASAWTVPKLRGLLVLFILVWSVSLFIGLLPLQPLDANAFSTYWSHYNSLRLAKGLVWGLVVFALFRSQVDQKNAFEKFSAGMALGVLGVSLWALWEEALFAGGATTADYRVTASFSSMHTGGGHIEAYLVIALPFVWGLFFRVANPLYRSLLGGIFLLGAYALFFTVARGGAIALVLALLILIWGTWVARRKQARHRARSAVPLVMGLLTLVVMVAGVSGAFWRERLEQTRTDAGIRLHHWADVLNMRDSGLMTSLFGQGLGSFPAVSLANQLPDQAG
ncbi:MAG: hypothetical protein WCA45_15645, partial [Thiobacillaceae bacterium]